MGRRNGNRILRRIPIDGPESEGRVPELPEVETIVRGLRAPLIGRRVLRTRLKHASLYRRGSLRLPWLVGRTIESVDRVGKNAVIRFRPTGLMLVNLGMTGRLTVCSSADEPGTAGAAHLHGRIYLDGDMELRYHDARRFGRFYIAKECDFERDLNIGPDPFVATERYLRETLVGRRAPIKGLLLDQRVVSGIGNIYADETLFYAGLDPGASGDVASARTHDVLSAARAVLTRAIEHGGSTIRDYRRHDGSTGGFQRFHAVYGREGQKCTRCASTIRKVTLAGRGTHYCPGCQR